MSERWGGVGGMCGGGSARASLDSVSLEPDRSHVSLKARPARSERNGEEAAAAAAAASARVRDAVDGQVELHRVRERSDQADSVPPRLLRLRVAALARHEARGEVAADLRDGSWRVRGKFTVAVRRGAEGRTLVIEPSSTRA